MKVHATPAIVLLGTLALPSTASAQLRGMASVWAAGLSERPLAGASDPTLLKAPMIPTTPPTPWMQPTGGPVQFTKDYSSAALFGAGLASFIEIDAHSIGSDLIPYPDEDGVPAVGEEDDNWLAYVVSVKDGASGIDGSYLDSLQNVRPVGAELISFYTSDSQNIANVLVGQAAVEASAMTLGYDGTEEGTRDVDALDYGLGIHTFTAQASGVSSVLFPESDDYFFSITPASVNTWNLLYGGTPFAGDQPPRAGDIYRKTWFPSTGWGPTQIYYSYEMLDLPEGADIDALSVNLSNGVVVFSTVQDPAEPAEPQLLISEGNWSHTELKDRDPVTGVAVSVQDKLDLGRERDDVDGLCGIDPEGASSYDRAVGTAIYAINSSPMGMSLQRGLAGFTGVESIMAQVSGWNGFAPTDCEVRLYYYLGSEPLSPNVNPFGPIPSTGVTPVWSEAGPFTRTASQDDFAVSVPFAPPGVAGYHLAVFGAVFELPQNGGAYLGATMLSQMGW